MKSKCILLSSILLGIGFYFVNLSTAQADSQVDEGSYQQDKVSHQNHYDQHDAPKQKHYQHQAPSHSHYGRIPHQKQKHGRLIHDNEKRLRVTSAKPARVSKKDTNKAVIKDYLVTLIKEVPESASVGEEVYWQYCVTAHHQDLAEVVVVDSIPAGLQYISSDPPADENADRLTWKFPLGAGEKKNLSVKLQTTGTGELGSCVTLTALPQGCASTFVGSPKLTIDKSGPEKADVNQKVDFHIMVKNEGTAAAHNVVITDMIPEGLAHEDGQSMLTYDVGTLAPGDYKKVSIPLTVKAGGKHCNTAKVEAANIEAAVQDDACFTVHQPGLSVVKKGPESEYLRKTTTYTIQVQNTGDVALTNVAVTDNVVSPMQLISAEGAEITGNTAKWTLPTLEVGAQENLTIMVKNTQAGDYCNSVSAVASNYNVSASDKACTQWQGVAAILLEVIDIEDPIRVGEATTYKISVTNQGSASDGNIRIAVKIPPELKLLTATGPAPLAAESNDSLVVFSPYEALTAGQKIDYYIEAEGLQ